MHVGVDSTKFPGAPGRPASWLLEQAAGLDLDGVSFRSVLELSPTLDGSEVREVSAQASP